MLLFTWTEQQYVQMVYDCGLAYLQNVIGNQNEEVLSYVRKSEVFWNWWKMNWEMRDAEFIEQLPELNLWEEEDEYKNIHNPRTLADAIYLNGQVLQESYAVMIGELNKTVTA